MRIVLALILKTVLGGILGAIIFLGLGSVKGFFDGLIEASPIYILTGILLGAGYASWLGGDLMLLAAFIGAEIVFLKNFNKILSNKYSTEVASKIFRTMFIALSLITTFGFYLKVRTIIQIESIYSEFCTAVQKKDYSSAYKYFSPEYQNQTNLNQFIEDKLGNYSSYVEGCSADTYSTKFVSSFGKVASVFPNSYIPTSSFANFPGGPEIIMKKIDGKWYFAGEDYWYMD